MGININIESNGWNRLSIATFTQYAWNYKRYSQKKPVRVARVGILLTFLPHNILFGTNMYFILLEEMNENDQIVVYEIMNQWRKKKRWILVSCLEIQN